MSVLRPGWDGRTGCTATTTCPNVDVPRGQMAPSCTGRSGREELRAERANLVALEGIATGCGGTNYCPLANVTRSDGRLPAPGLRPVRADPGTSPVSAGDSRRIRADYTRP
jgi:hypothetical protein